jgi:C4-dicarboxylate-specific signal transduction histidine kinase
MNTDKLIKMLSDYLQLLQSQEADDDQIINVKLMIWAIEDDLKLRQFLNNLPASNRYYRR